MVTIILLLHYQKINKMDIPKALKTIRTLRGISQTNLAKEIGKTPQIINYWEAGKYNPTPESIKKLCKVFKISPDLFYLLALEPKKIKAKKSTKDLVNNIIHQLKYDV